MISLCKIEEMIYVEKVWGIGKIIIGIVREIFFYYLRKMMLMGIIVWIVCNFGVGELG